MIKTARRLVPLAASLAAGLAVLNRRLRAAPDALRNHLGGTERRWTWRGYDLFATEAGSGPTVLLIHGIYAGSSSYEYRHLFPLLARSRRVVAIDLLGCGRSDRPNIDYTAELFIEQIVAAVDEFGGASPALVGSSLGAAFTVIAAARLGARIGGLAVVAPTGLAGTLDGPRKPAGRAVTAIFRSPLIGEALFNALASRASLGWFLRNQAYADPSSATPQILDDYSAVTHQPGSRYVPAHFVGGALNCSIAADLPRIEAPTMIAWGAQAITGPSPIASAPQYVALARNARLVAFERSRLLPHEEEPEAFATALLATLDR